jgi:glutathione S-transferase
MFAHELGIDYELVVVHDLKSTDPANYQHPALKLPVLRDGDSVVFGTENICRTLAGDRWVETPASLRNAQELAWHAMQAQVQIVMGTIIGKLPADNIYFEKIRRGFEGAMAWLDANIVFVPRDATLLPITLFCLVEHIRFRPTLTLEAYPALATFAHEFGTRPSAVATAYRFD